MMCIGHFYNRYRNIILYGIIGCMGATLDFICYTILTILFNVYYLYANIFGVIVGITNNFFLNRNLNFRIKDHAVIRYLSFFSIGIIGLILSIILLKFFVDILQIQQLVAKFVTIFFVVGLQFLFNKMITFRS